MSVLFRTSTITFNKQWFIRCKGLIVYFQWPDYSAHISFYSHMNQCLNSDYTALWGSDYNREDVLVVWCCECINLYYWDFFEVRTVVWAKVGPIGYVQKGVMLTVRRPLWDLELKCCTYYNREKGPKYTLYNCWLCTECIFRGMGVRVTIITLHELLMY